MMRYLSANYIYPIHEAPIKHGVVEVSSQGQIVAVHRFPTDIDPNRIEHLEGIIVPGFVNAHCHLELSHLKGKIEPRRGLTSFLKSVMQRPQASEEQILQSMEEADAEMSKNGIIAVGDISNGPVSKSIKQKSKLYYHTFIEILGFDPKQAEEVFKKGVDLCTFFHPLRSSLAPHAPYSVSKDLFRFIRFFCDKEDNLLSIHNQESEAENKFFRYKQGPFIDFYQDLGRNIDFFKPKARNSLRTIAPLLPQSEHILMVHNTYTTYKDLNFMDRYDRQVTWCFCPNANLYIEGRLPNIKLFRDAEKKIVLGTDSLASNNGLSILEEMKTIAQHDPDIPIQELLTWGTLNGAEYFDIADTYGSIEPGKTPGLNLIENVSNGKLLPNSTVRKLL